MKNRTPSERAAVVMDQIRNGKEMEVVLKETVFSPSCPFPPRGQRLRLWQALHRMDIPFLTRLAMLGILRHLPGVASSALNPGFKCLFGNIYAEGASLHDTVFVDYANVYIGKGTGFSYQNLVITSSHDFEDMRKVPAREIVIGENVWVTSRVIILPGVHIGRNSIIGAASLVSRDIPPDVFAAGNPAVPIRPVKRGTTDGR